MARAYCQVHTDALCVIRSKYITIKAEKSHSTNSL